MLHVIANTKQQARQFSSPTPDRFAVLHANMGLHDARLPESQSICRLSRDQDLYSSMSAALCCISINRHLMSHVSLDASSSCVQACYASSVTLQQHAMFVEYKLERKL